MQPPPFQTFFREQAPAVARFLSGMVPAADVDECLQETFLAALRAYKRFDGANPRAWALTIARRKAVDHQRAAARRPSPDATVAVRAVAAAGPEEGPLWAEVAALPPRQRAAIVLRYRLDMPHAEIAGALGCSEQAARRSLFEALQKLRQGRVQGVAA